MNLSQIVFAALIISIGVPSVQAQSPFRQLAHVEPPVSEGRRFVGGRVAEISKDGKTLIAAFYGSRAQLFDLAKQQPVTKPIPTSGDGEVGFVNNNIAYTADWDSVRLWNTKNGSPIGQPLPHVLREDTIIAPAISPDGKRLVTRSTMTSLLLWNVETQTRVGKSARV